MGFSMSLLTEQEIGIQRLRRKLEQKNQRISGLERRIAKLEHALAIRSGDTVVVDTAKLRHDLEKAVVDAFCNVRMIPVLGIGGSKRIVEVKVSDEGGSNGTTD